MTNRKAVRFTITSIVSVCLIHTVIQSSGFLSPILEAIDVLYVPALVLTGATVADIFYGDK